MNSIKTKSIDTKFHYLAVVLLGIFLSLVWYQNFEISQIENSQTLTFMKMFRDWNLYPDSFLLKKIYALHLYSAYYWIVGVVGLLFDPYWTLYGYFILINCVCIAGLFFLSRTITGRSEAGLLSVLALTLQGQWGHGLGGSTPFGLAPYPDQIAIGLLLFSFAFFLKDRPRLALAVAGLTFNFHASFSLFVLFSLGVALLVQKQFRDLIVGSATALLLASPVLVYILTHPLSPADAAPELGQWIDLIRMRSSGHTMPLSWGFGTYVKFLPYPFVFFLGYRALRKDLKDKVGLFCIGLLILCLIGTIFADLSPVPFIIKLTPIRCTVFFVIISVILFSRVYVREEIRAPIKNILMTGLMAGLITASFPLTFATIGGLYVLWIVGDKKIPLILFAVPPAVAMISVVAWRKFGGQIILSKSHLAPFAVVFSVLLAYAALLSRSFSRKWIQPIAMGIIVASTLFTPVYARFSDVGYFQSVKDLQLWLRDNTPPHRPIILPPSSGIWSGLSERSDTFSYVEAGYPIYAPHLTQEVFDRFEDYVENPLGFKEGDILREAMIKSYNAWDEQKFQEVAGKYDSDYAVVTKNKSLNFPVSYQNDFFLVYKVPPLTKGSPP